MKNLRSFIVFTLIIFPGLQKGTTAQEIEITDSEILISKMRLPILPDDKKSKYYSFDDEVAILISEVVKQLRLYDVIVGINIDSALEKQNRTTTKGKIVAFKQIEDFREAIVITETNISQKGVPPNEDEVYFSLKRSIFKKRSQKQGEAYPNNISTEITVLSYFFNVETGEFLGCFDLTVTFVGGSREKSKVKALEELKKKAITELKRIYWFSSDIVSTKNGIIKLPIGTNQGLEKGMIFEIVEPDRIWTDGNEEFLVPGGIIGFASVTDTATDSSSLKILRQWQDHYAESWVVERSTPIVALQLNFVPPATDSYINLGIHFHAKPLQSFDWGLGMQISRVIDSFADKDFGFGFAGFGIWRFLNMSRLDLGGKLGLDLDIPFKKDDDGELVNTILFSAHIGFIAEFPLTPKADFVLNVGYRFGVKSNKWEYSENDETYSAYWKFDSPEVDNSGFMLSVGYKYFLF